MTTFIFSKTVDCRAGAATNALCQSPAAHKSTVLRRTVCAASQKASDNGVAPPAVALPGGAQAVVTDAAVPEGHEGLHTYLYGDGGAEEHDSSLKYNFREGEDDGSTLIDVQAYLTTREDEKPFGVYALYDRKNNLQYVSYSRNIVLAIKSHLGRVGEDRCARCRVMVFANKAMQSRSALQREADNWLNEAGTVPPGNGAERYEWEGNFDTSSFSDAELAEYEDKKNKMRKAMGENLADAVEGETIDAKQRRLNLIQAVEGDNWSSVIDGQTKETVTGDMASAAGGGGATGEHSSEPAHPAASPFSRASVHRGIGTTGGGDGHGEDGGNGGGGKSGELLMMNVENVDEALNEVRPYLIADGGNVEVIAVENGIVMLQLQGACGTCPSSTATMKMGIERSLKAAFGDQLKEVMQVGSQAEGASAPAVDAQLNALRGAIHSYGGFVEVLSVGMGVCELKYKGPVPIGYGIRAAVLDRFKDLKEIVMVDADTGEIIKFE